MIFYLGHWKRSTGTCWRARARDCARFIRVRPPVRLRHRSGAGRSCRRRPADWPAVGRSCATTTRACAASSMRRWIELPEQLVARGHRAPPDARRNIRLHPAPPAVRAKNCGPRFRAAPSGPAPRDPHDRDPRRARPRSASRAATVSAGTTNSNCTPVHVPAFSIAAIQGHQRRLSGIRQSRRRGAPISAGPRGQWCYRGMFEEIPLPLDWPVYVTHDEAQAYARWSGMRAAHRSAIPSRRVRWRSRRSARRERRLSSTGIPSRSPLSPPERAAAFRNWSATVGNGPPRLSRPSPASSRSRSIPAIRANFFDGPHYVLKGGSPRTAPACCGPASATGSGRSIPTCTPLSGWWKNDSRDNSSAREVRAGLSQRRAETAALPNISTTTSARRCSKPSRCLPEYGLTRADTRLSASHAGEITAYLPAPVAVAELGSGSGTKTALILEARWRQAGNLLSHRSLRRRAGAVRAGVGPARRGVHPLDATLSGRPAPGRCARRHGETLLVLFLGSTIGNFARAAAERFPARRCAPACMPGDALLLGADLVKPLARMLLAPTTIPRASPRRSICNLLARINRELDADFELRSFAHEARWNAHAAPHRDASARRSSRSASRIRAARIPMRSAQGETIWTESSHKFHADEIAAMAARAGFDAAAQWIDDTMALRRKPLFA